MKYIAGIIGAGFIGNRFGNSIHKHPDITISWVYDIDKPRAEQLAVKFGAKASDRLEDLLDDPDLDIIYIGTPPLFHSQLCVKSLNAGKHVICEKPIAMNQKEVFDMIKARDRNNKQTAINLPFRFNVEFDEIRQLMTKDEIGNIISIEIRLRFPEWPREWQKVKWLGMAEQGGALREVGTHYLFGVEELFGRIDSVRAWTIFPDDIRCETGSNALLRLENGLICNLNLIIGGNEYAENSLIIYGSDGMIYHRQWAQLSVLKDGVERKIEVERVNSEYELVCNFVDVLNDENAKNLLVDFETAGRAQKILEDILNSKI